MSVKITLPDGNQLEFDHKPNGLDVAETIGPRLAKDTVGIKINGSSEVQDFRTVLEDGSKVELVTLKSEDSLEVIRHSAAHVMAQAVQELWPEVKVTIGPVIRHGFYYDFDTDRAFSEEDLEKSKRKCKRSLRETSL